jgi:translation initiation factor 2B subunit (eIF-2B alpha/beta/delta family)
LNAKVHRDQIHPSVLRLALQYADFKIVGANARCVAMLEAFKDVRSWLAGRQTERTWLTRRSSRSSPPMSSRLARH